MNFKILNDFQVYGLATSMKASGNPMRTTLANLSNVTTPNDISRARKLANTKSGEGHDNFLKGIIVQFNVVAPLYWWKQAQRYHWFDFISSQSTMHCLLKFDIKEQCTEDVDERVINIMEELVANYNNCIYVWENSNKELTLEKFKKNLWRKIIATLPCGFCLGATMTTNYQQLKTMYHQRRNHKLEEWHTFCDWVERLPNSELITGVK